MPSLLAPRASHETLFRPVVSSHTNEDAYRFQALQAIAPGFNLGEPRR